MSNQKGGWNFPSSGGGLEAGFNDPGIETFNEDIFGHLAREVIQNSLDARVSNEKPVTVSFQLEKIPSEEFPGRKELLDAMKKCLTASGDSDKTKKFFKKAISTMKGKNITCLRIQDYNTTGLRDGTTPKDGQWHNLVKTIGTSEKKSDTAGGSFGIGKSAPFAVSGLRTVFYATRYTESDNSVKEYAQGRAVLVSHDLGKGDYSQAVGFYGIKEKCGRLSGDVIPSRLRCSKEDGTTLLIAGLNEAKEWDKKIVAAVISNYFYAIWKKDLTVLLDSQEKGLGLIDADTLPALLEDTRIRKIEGEDDNVERAYAYYRAICSEPVEASGGNNLMNPSKLWVLVEPGLPQGVAILRRGMKITDSFKGLGPNAWVKCADFAAVFLCENDEGNALLREMENPAHDNFSEDKLEAGDVRIKGKKLLNQIRKWIKGQVKDLVQQEMNAPIPLDHMKRLFASEGELAGENTEVDFDGTSRVEMKPYKPSLPKPVDIGEENSGELDSGEEEEHEHHGESGGSKNKGGDKGTRTIPIEIDGLRILPVDNEELQKCVMFTPRQSGAAILSLSIAGDSFIEMINIGKVSLEVYENERVSIEVKLPENVGHSALSVSLVKKDNGGQG